MNIFHLGIKKHIERRLYTLLFVALLSLTGSLQAQFVPTKVVRSSNIIQLDGQKYFLHQVKAGHTLFSISKEYGVSIKRIAKANPVIQYDNIKLDQVLKIPMVEITDPIGEQQKDHSQFIYHIVEPKQTLSAISRKYKVSVGELVRLNPGVETVLPLGKELRLPRTQVSAIREDIVTPPDPNFSYHKVEALETLFSLSRSYGLSVKQIKEVNPGLKWGLTEGEVIRIPKDSRSLVNAENAEFTAIDSKRSGQIENVQKETSWEEIVREKQVKEEKIREEVATENINKVTAQTTNEISTSDNWLSVETSADCAAAMRLHNDKHFKVAFLLPLYVTANDTLHLNDSVPFPKNDMYREALRFLEFMEGSLLAIDSLRQSGLSMDVHIYDTERDANRVRQLVTSGKLNSMDLIIGPVYPETLEIVSIFSRIRRIPLISPLSTRGIGIDDNPYLFQINPTTALQHDLASIYLSRSYDKNILLVRDTNDFSAATNRYSRNIRNYLTYKLNPSDLRYRQVLFTDKNRSVNMDDSLAFRLEDVLSLHRENLIIIPSTNKVFVSDMVNRLNNLSLHYDITLFGRPEWGKFDALQMESLYNLNLHYYTNFSNPYVNYADSLTLDVCKRYRLNFNNEPSRFSFQGFDVTHYFVKALYLFGDNFISSVDCWPEVLVHPTLQTSFHFVKHSGQGGFENQALSIVRYNQQNLVKEKISSTATRRPE